ncbi:TetR/AcrR family transcriptional regulator, partial [Arthrobacter deserti]|nr:TetR/AcrR family transcriptional regulator [Arthrobacter deserti]
FRDEAAVAAYRAFSSFLLGHLLLEVAAQGTEIGPAESGGGPARETGALDGYPQVLGLQELLSEDRSGDEFEESLENLLNRLEALNR